jgi:hypothetical protein
LRRFDLLDFAANPGNLPLDGEDVCDLPCALLS